VNDGQSSERVAEALRRYFPSDCARDVGRAPAGEDFGCSGAARNAPSVDWFVAVLNWLAK